MRGPADNLAMSYQEILTVTMRLRANRQTVTNAAAFRAQVLAGLKAAEQEAVSKGYAPEDGKLATFAIVAFLDETILNSQNPGLNDWLRKPLQEELFGVHVAGQICFDNVDRLLMRPDSPQVADILEVYLLCVLLGFRGKYGATGGEGIRAAVDAMKQKIDRVRGPAPAIPGLPLHEGARAAARDPWTRGMLWAAVACIVLALALLATYRLALGGGVARAETAAQRARV
ncbi:MAG TPA: DotU family type IV/VI secretion system protein [Bryobacteraceae bacterium]|nr:DotU family type IV/VI secretion system protein [Bryobacteraceae bacterium]